MSEIFTRYLYLWGSIAGVGVFWLIYRSRKDLRRRMLRMGVAVAFAGVISERVFFQDYWHPPLIFRFGEFGGVEDLIFGFAAGGIGVVLYDVVFHKRLRKKGYPHYWIISLLMVSEVLCVTVVGPLLDLNSIYSSAIGFIIPACVIMAVRRDLIVETLYSAVLGGSLLALMEMLFLIFAPNYLQQYYLLYGNAPLIFGIIPLTEFLWGAAFAGLVGPLRDFELGYVPVSMRRRVPAKASRKR